MFAHDATYSDSKHLAKSSISDKIFKNWAYEIARNNKHDEYKGTLASMVNKFFDEKTESGGVAISKVRISVNEQLAEELRKPVIKTLKRRKVYARFNDNI